MSDFPGQHHSTANDAVKFCIDNRPDWTERTFFQKLPDVLTFGVLPLCRTFFSSESKLQKTMPIPEENSRNMRKP